MRFVILTALTLTACDGGNGAAPRQKGDRETSKKHQEQDATEADTDESTTITSDAKETATPPPGKIGEDKGGVSLSKETDTNEAEEADYRYVAVYKVNGTIGYTDKTFPFTQDVTYEVTRPTIKATTANARAERSEVQDSLTEKQGTKEFTRPTHDEMLALQKKPGFPYLSYLLYVKSVRLPSGGSTTFDPPLPALLATKVEYKKLEGHELKARSTATAATGTYTVEWTAKLVSAGVVNLHYEIITTGTRDLGDGLEAIGLPQDMTLHVATGGNVFSAIDVTSYYKNKRLEGSPADMIGTPGFPGFPGGGPPGFQDQLNQMSARQPAISKMRACSLEKDGKTQNFPCG